jgi:hypothetical protein
LPVRAAGAKLTGIVIAFHMDMRRLVAIEAHEEEPIWTRNIEDSRHPNCSNTTDALILRIPLPHT